MKTRYEVIDWTSEPAVSFGTDNIHEAREMLASAASLGFNPATTFIWDNYKALESLSSPRGKSSLIHSARIVVRETGAVARDMERARIHLTAGISHIHAGAMHAYDMACAHLTQLDPAGAAEFIRSTYGPLFRQTEVTR